MPPPPQLARPSRAPRAPLRTADASPPLRCNDETRAGWLSGVLLSRTRAQLITHARTAVAAEGGGPTGRPGPPAPRLQAAPVLPVSRPSLPLRSVLMSGYQASGSALLPECRLKA